MLGVLVGDGGTTGRAGEVRSMRTFLRGVFGGRGSAEPNFFMDVASFLSILWAAMVGSWRQQRASRP